MTALSVADEIFERFPDVVLGVVVVHGIDNSGEHGEVREQLRQAEAQILERFAGAQVTEHPQIAPWREAYRAFGAKPKDNPSSIENLLRRALKGQQLRTSTRWSISTTPFRCAMSSPWRRRSRCDRG